MTEHENNLTRLLRLESEAKAPGETRSRVWSRLSPQVRDIARENLKRRRSALRIFSSSNLRAASVVLVAALLAAGMWLGLDPGVPAGIVIEDSTPPLAGAQLLVSPPVSAGQTVAIYAENKMVSVPAGKALSADELIKKAAVTVSSNSLSVKIEGYYDIAFDAPGWYQMTVPAFGGETPLGRVTITVEIFAR